MSIRTGKRAPPNLSLPWHAVVSDKGFARGHSTELLSEHGHSALLCCPAHIMRAGARAKEQILLVRRWAKARGIRHAARDTSRRMSGDLSPFISGLSVMSILAHCSCTRRLQIAYSLVQVKQQQAEPSQAPQTPRPAVVGPTCSVAPLPPFIGLRHSA